MKNTLDEIAQLISAGYSVEDALVKAGKGDFVFDTDTTFGGNVTIDGTTLKCGVEDTATGTLILYGSAVAEGGEIRLHTAADSDTNFQSFIIDTYGETLRFIGQVQSLSLNGTTGDATFDGSVILPDAKWSKYGTSGEDLWVGHDGTHSYIWQKPAAAGGLYISNSAASSLTRIHNANSVGTDKTSIVTGGATTKVDQYYDGAVTTSTSATGFDLAAGKELTLDRTTDDDGFINFKATIDADATSAVSSFTTSAATTHHIQILINGTPAWIAVSTTDPTA